VCNSGVAEESRAFRSALLLTWASGPREEPAKLVPQPHTSSHLLPLWQVTVVGQSLESSFYHALLQIPHPAITVKDFSWICGKKTSKCS